VELFGYWFDGGWGLPGGLTREEMETDPRQADAYSVAGNASFEHRTGRLGVRHVHRFDEHWEHRITLYAGSGAKENPYGTSPYYQGYKIEDHQGGGYRNELEWQQSFGELSTRLIVGSEGQSEINSLRNFDNEKGRPGTMRENSNTHSRIGLFFLQNEWELPLDLKATVGLSYNRVEYRHRDLYMADSVDYSNRFRFSPGWVPRFSLVKGLGEDWSLHASVSEGFSAPTVWELIDPDGSVNTDLEAEKGRNFEAGLRGQLLQGRVAFDLTCYWFRLRDAILAEERIGNQAIYGNIGRTEQKGIEAVIDLILQRDAKSWFREAKLQQSYAYQHYVFGDHPIEGENFKGKRIPGVPYQTWDQVLSFRTAPGLYLRATGRFVGRTPISNGNTVYRERYYVLDGKIGFRHALGDRFRLHLYGGVQNAMDERYSAFLQVNNPVRSYYNPAPGRMWYGGIGLRYSFER
jgi:iron complex outermembrane receptor protein